MSRDRSSTAGLRQTLLASNGQSGVYVARLGFVDKNGHGNTGQFASDPGSVDDQSSSSKGAFPGRLCWPDWANPTGAGAPELEDQPEALYFVAETAGGSMMTLVEPARNGLRDWAAHQS